MQKYVLGDSLKTLLKRFAGFADVRFRLRSIAARRFAYKLTS